MEFSCFAGILNSESARQTERKRKNKKRDRARERERERVCVCDLYYERKIVRELNVQLKYIWTYMKRADTFVTFLEGNFGNTF